MNDQLSMDDLVDKALAPATDPAAPAPSVSANTAHPVVTTTGAAGSGVMVKAEPQALAVSVRRRPATESSNLLTTEYIVDNLERVWRYASNLAAGCKLSASEAFWRIQAGSEIGIPPAAAIREVYNVQGRTCLSAASMMGACRRFGVKFRITHSTPPGEWCEVQATRGEESYGFRWTIDMAKRVGLAGRDNWKHYPWDMLFARAASHVCRKIAPDVCGGMYDPEEVSTPSAVDGLEESVMAIDEEASA